MRSAYLEQVRRIAPEWLRDRDRELAELAAFCTADGAGPYGWWRAPAWTGKSALMSWFVLHPPAGVRIVSFFVTARFKAQSDREAFIEVVLEQLAELLDQPMPAHLTDATRDAHLLGMLTAAAERCRARGERLVLVVDGLDEDRGVTAGPDAYSIAGLLPARPLAGMRVVVAGRPDPPVPSDVPAGHPLLDPAIVRAVERSRYATLVQQDAERELKRLLHGPAAEQDLLGLVTAGGGGLSGADLAELTGWPRWQVEEHLHSVAGRTFARRASRYQHGGPEVYVLGHEELQNRAAHYLADRLPGYRDRLHAWADGYRARGWPDGTPEYLLRGYHRLLVSTGDLPRAVACATDADRHDRMLDISGGDTAALTEITATQDLTLAQPDPDLLALARLASHASDLADRNVHIPAGLPAVWERLGHPARAEALARSISNPTMQVQALTGLVRAARDPDRTRALADQAATAAGALTDPNQRASALTTVALAATAGGDLDRAETIAAAIAVPDQRIDMLIAVAGAAALGGDAERAARLVRQVEAEVHSLADPYDEAVTLAGALAVTGTGGPERLAEVLRNAEAEARSIPDPEERVHAMLTVAVISADAGDAARAARLARETGPVIRATADPKRRGRALADLANAEARAGDPDGAGATAREITDPAFRVGALGDLARALAAAGDTGRAAALAAEAASTTRLIADSGQRALELAVLVTTAAEAGASGLAADLARQAEAATHGIPDAPDMRGTAGVVVDRLARAGALDLDRAEAMVRMDTDPLLGPRRMATLAEVSVAAGEAGRAARLAHEAENAARSRTNPADQNGMLAALAQALAIAGDLDRAEAVAGMLPSLEWLFEALADVIEAATSADRAADLAERVEAMARAIADPSLRISSLARLGRTAAAIGDSDRALALARHAEAEIWVAAPVYERRTPLDVVQVLIAVGDLSAAKTVARAIAHPLDKARALADLASAAVAAGKTDRAAALVRRAERAAHRAGDPSDTAYALAAVAPAVAAAGDLAHARAMADSITELHLQARALADLVPVTARAGDTDQAAALLERAETVARSVRSLWQQSEALAHLAGVAADAGDPAGAVRLAQSIAEPAEQARTLAVLATHKAAPDPRRILGLALRLGWGPDHLTALAHVEPAAVGSLADDLLVAAAGAE